MTMPETSMNKNTCVITFQDDIRFYFSNFLMKTKSKPKLMQTLSHSKLRLCIFRLRCGHFFRLTLEFKYYVKILYKASAGNQALIFDKREQGFHLVKFLCPKLSYFACFPATQEGTPAKFPALQRDGKSNQSKVF